MAIDMTKNRQHFLVAQQAENNKKNKSPELSVEYEFFHAAVETLGSWGADAMCFINAIRRVISHYTGKRRSALF